MLSVFSQLMLLYHPSGEDENTQKPKPQKFLGMTGDQLAINKQNCGEHSKNRYMNRSQDINIVSALHKSLELSSCELSKM